MDCCSVFKSSIQVTQFFSTLYMLWILSMSTALAQTVNTTPPTSSTNSPGFNFTMVAILVTLIIIFSLVVLSTICISNRAFGHMPFSSFTSGAFTTPVFTLSPRTSHGLDRNVLDTFPIIKYTEIMELKHSKNPLECQVCLSEFSDHDMLRLIPGCCHLFHPTCIDAWLTHNVNCPICRSDLTKAAIVSVNNTSVPVHNNQIQGNMSRQDLMEVPLKRFKLMLPVHLTEEIQVSDGHRLSASIAGRPYDVTVDSKSGRLWSFTRTYSNRSRNNCIGEMAHLFSTGSHTERSVSAPEVHDPV